MKTTTYQCDECGLPIDGKNGPQPHVVMASDLVVLIFDCYLNRPADLHLHRCCSEAIRKRIGSVPAQLPQEDK